LDKCFRNFGRKYYWQDLLDAVNKVLIEHNGENSGVNRTQLFKDMRFMESEAGFSAPIKRYPDGRKKFYRYEDKEYSIHQSPLTFQESESIKDAIFVLARFRGLPQFEWLNEVIPMLSDKLSISDNKKEIILFESNIDYSGTEFIEQIFNAIKNSRVLKIAYKDFVSESPYEIIFHPYILKQYNNRWFSFGMNEKNKIRNWNLALDRIYSIEEIDLKYEDYDIDWEDDYFYDMIGVTKGRNPKLETIILEIDKNLTPYITTKPIHPTQKTKEILSNGNSIITIQVYPNYELETHLLSFGEKVKIVSPLIIRDKIKKRLEVAIALYKSS
ncbi:YafY family protein, partial [Aureispira sp. CCB-QB1]|uniref:helix-turn-helix transcriptional regulator n=1 Tax=Aureispira sp. CCB-QB1 TaxID=1313421 RepID=UPI0006962DBB